MASKSFGILFFCLGNICRSPIAEAVMAQLVAEAGLGDQIRVDSAATSTYESGNQPDHRTQAVAQAHGYHLHHVSRQLRFQDLEHFGLIIGMEDKNLDDAFRLLRPSAEQKAKFRLLRDWDPVGKGIVPDPYYGNNADFELVQTIVMRTMPALLADVKSRLV